MLKVAASHTGPLASGWRPARTEPYRFERRRTPRRAITGRATAVRGSHDPAAHRCRIFHLELQNVSDDALAALTDIPLPVNEPVVVHLPAADARPGFAGACGPIVRGHVLRCASVAAKRPQDDEVYQIVISFDPPAAA